MFKFLLPALLSSCAVYQVKPSPESKQVDTVLVKISFDGDGGGLIDVGSANKYCIKDCVVKVEKGSIIDVHPTAEHGSKFLGFAGDCYGESCTLNTVEDLEIFVSFGNGMLRSPSSEEFN